MKKEGYELRYVLVGGKWQLKLVLVDAGGNIVTESGSFVEYEGDYSLDGVVFEVNYRYEYVSINDPGLYDEEHNLKDEHLYVKKDGAQVSVCSSETRVSSVI